MKSWLTVPLLAVLTSTFAMRVADADPESVTVVNKSPDAVVGFTFQLSKIANSDVPDTMDTPGQRIEPTAGGKCVQPGHSIRYIVPQGRRARTDIFVYLSHCHGPLVLVQKLDLTHKYQTYTLVKTAGGKYEIQYVPH